MIRLTAVIELDGHAPRALAHEFSKSVVTIGRESDADFQIPLSTVSRQHARIAESEGVYVIEDLGSTHGTMVNGRKLGKGEKKVLRNGDIVEITKAKITCIIEGEKLVAPQPGEGTQAIAERAVQGILGRLGDAKTDGPYLRVLNGPDEGVRFTFAGSLSEWTLGRSKECEFILNDPNVSRRHATIKKDWTGFMAHDLGSKNGVQINDQTIKGSRRLKDRDEITIGPVQLVFVDPDADLLAALKDVPGFAVDETADMEAISDAEASHMGAPEEQAGGKADSGSSPTPEEAASSGPAVADQAGEDNAAEDLYEKVDPELLKAERGARIDWIILAGAGVIVVVSILLLFVLVP